MQMCNLIPVAKTVGSNRIVPTISIPYPLGDPATTKEEQWKLRYHRTKSGGGISCSRYHRADSIQSIKGEP